MHIQDSLFRFNGEFRNLSCLANFKDTSRETKTRKVKSRETKTRKVENWGTRETKTRKVESRETTVGWWVGWAVVQKRVVPVISELQF